MKIAIARGELTKQERFKLFRNLFILLFFDMLLLSFIVLMMVLYRNVDLISIVSSTLVALFIILIGIYASKYIRDLKKGLADIYSGTVKRKEEDEVVGDDVGSQYLYLNNQRFQVGFRTYLKVKENDQVTIRKAPVSKCTLTVRIIKENKPEN